MEEEEETTSAEDVPESANWQGDWFISADSSIIGNLSIFNETDEGFYFNIKVSNNNPTKSVISSELIISIKGISGYAQKDGLVAISEKEANGCLLTFHMGVERIQVKESKNCADPELTVDFNHSFIPPETFVLDEHFIESIKEGRFTPDGYAIGTSIMTIMHALGEPDAEINRNEALYRIYSNTGYGTAGGDKTVGLLTVIRPEKLTPDDIKELFGEPEQEGLSELEGLYIYYYIIDDEYELYFEFLPGEKTLLRFHLRELKLM
ncbi:hypothetical protein AB685_08780 [Bacillus sp. LL01]|nr:hypothetical protein AB685_08780 [Bacillus sp. LL01]